MDTSARRSTGASRPRRPAGSARAVPVGARPGIRLGRRGAALLVAMVVTIVASAVFLSILKVSVAERQRALAEAWQVQAAWLAESGVERAAARLAADPDYQGETWNLPADQLGGRYGAVVRIDVKAAPEQDRGRLVRCRADYPDDPSGRARVSKQVIIDLRP